MDPLTELINTLYQLVIGVRPQDEDTMIKKHSRCLEKLGDVSLPLSSKVWRHIIQRSASRELGAPGLVHQFASADIDIALGLFQECLRGLKAQIRTHKCIKTSAHLFLERAPLFNYAVKRALAEAGQYGRVKLFNQVIRITTATTTYQTVSDLDQADLTTLRLSILKATIENLLKLSTKSEPADSVVVALVNNVEASTVSNASILCGPVLNEQGVKDTEHTARDFFQKRVTDMRLMAQHRYRVNIQSAQEWKELFTHLGRASVSVELLSNKPQKSVKVTLDNLGNCNKGPAFIFYNCARLSILLKEFDLKVQQGTYPDLPALDQIDFSLLKQPEEWELLYVYILQYPHMVQSCIKGVELGNVNPQHLVSFLSNLSSVFSIYYRRVRILVAPREHLF
ncbi:hypothetical protein D910_01170, partial [Dendroctonus ponderosae]